MNKLLTVSLLLLLTMLSPVRTNAQDSRITTLQGARNLVISTADGHTFYYLVSADHSYMMHRLGQEQVAIGTDTFNVGDIRSMRFHALPRFSLDEDSTAFGDDYSIDHGLLAFRRTFSVGQWNSMVVPFSLTAAQVLDAFGEGTLLARYRGVVEDQVATVEFETIDTDNPLATVIEAGHYYLICPMREPDLRDGQTTSIVYGSGRMAGPLYVIPNVSMASGQSAPDNEVLRSDEGNVRLRQRGTYARQDVSLQGKRLFSLGDEGYFQQLTETAPLKAFRSWIEEVRNNGQLPLRFYINGIQADLTEPSSIEQLMADRLSEDNTVVYDLHGRRIDISSNAGRHAGIYIVRSANGMQSKNRKKIVIH